MMYILVCVEGVNHSLFTWPEQGWCVLLKGSIDRPESRAFPAERLLKVLTLGNSLSAASILHKPIASSSKYQQLLEVA